MNHLQYLLVMAACVVATLPLELVLGARVWRRPGRLVRALAAPVVVFSLWDVAAIAHHHWRYAARYVTGIDLPGHLPLEEVVFFVVVPVCAVLTFEVVSRMLGPDRHRPLAVRLVPALGRRRAPPPAGLRVYTVWALAAVAAVVAIEVVWARTGIFRRPAYWVTIAITWAFQVPVDGWLTKLSAPIVIYNPAELSGVRFPWDIPVEDFAYGFALVTVVLILWVRATAAGSVEDG